MADVKISQLPQATLPLSGAEVFPIVQNGVTVQASVGSVGTAANITALRSTPPVAGAVISVDGYYTIGDGGGGQFYGVSGGTYTDDGGVVITQNGSTSTSAWLRIVKGQIVSVRMFGAKGDSTTDDTTAIQTALNNATTYGYRRISFPRVVADTGSSYYRIQSPIIIPVGVELVGDGDGITYIRAQDCDGFVINAGGGNVIIRDMSITAYAGAVIDPKINTGISCLGVAGSIVSNVDIIGVSVRGFNVGLNFEYTWNSVIQNYKTVNCLTGFRLYGQSVNNSVSDCSISADTYCIQTEKTLAGVRGEGLMIANSLLASANYGIYTTGFLSLNVSNCVIDLMKTSCIYSSAASVVLIDNCWLACTTGTKGIEIGAVNAATSPFYYTHLYVTNSYIYTPLSNSVGIDIGVNNRGISVSNCSFTTGAAATNTYAVKTVYSATANAQSQVTVTNCTAFNALNATPLYFATPNCVANNNYNMNIEWDASQGIPSQSLAPVAVLSFNGVTGATYLAKNCSVIRNGIGDYTVTFNHKLANTAFVPVISASPGGNNALGITAQTFTVNGFNIAVKNQSGSVVDSTFINLAIYS